MSQTLHVRLSAPSAAQSPRVTVASAAAGLDPKVEELVRLIHAAPAKAVIYATGGASQALSWLLSVPGASNTVLEVAVPYSRTSLEDLLKKAPEQYCSEATALDLARAAYQQAAHLSRFGTQILGVAATCALATEPPKRGEHRAYVAVHSGTGTCTYSTVLAKGVRSRWAEDDVASRLLLRVLADACGGAAAAYPLDTGLHALGDGTDSLEVREVAFDGALARVVSGAVRCVEVCGATVTVDAPRGRRVYLSGSFNPLHVGHQRLLSVACEMVGDDAEGCFELSIVNADKGALALAEVERRVAGFVERGLPVLVSRAPLFKDKAALLPGSAFVVGVDTAVRLVMPKYYGGHDQMMRMFDRLRSLGVRFLVGGRKVGGDPFLNLTDVQIPEELADLFTDIPESRFREDISSTEIRRKLGLKV